MKVQGPGPTQGASKSKKSSKASEADGSFEDFIASGPTKAAGVSATQAIVQVDALLAVQGSYDAAQGGARKRSQQRASTILNELDKIRISMLNGTLTIGHMIDIADVVASHRDRINDPALTAIMDEIDLRAQVELAKMRVALDNRAPA